MSDTAPPDPVPAPDKASVAAETPKPVTAVPKAEPWAEQPASVSAGAPARPEPVVVRRGGVGLFTVMLFAGLSAVGGAALSLAIQARPDLVLATGIGRFVPLPKAPATDAATSALMADVAALSSKVVALEQRLQVQPPGGAALAPATPAPETPSPAEPGAAAPAPAALPQAVIDAGNVRGEVQGLGGRVTAIETRLAALDPTGAGGAIVAAMQADIATLKVTVQALQAQVASAPPAGVTMAVLSLIEAAGRPGAFLPEFEAVRSALPVLPEVAALEPLARSGAPTRAILQERFATLAPAVEQMARATNDEGGLTGWLRGLLSDMIKVSPAKTDSGAAATLARAKAKLDQGDLQGAADDVGSIAPAPDAAREWVSGARKRLDLESRLAALRGAVERGGGRPAAPAQISTGPEQGAAQPLPQPPLSLPAPNPPSPAVPAPGPTP